MNECNYNQAKRVFEKVVMVTVQGLTGRLAQIGCLLAYSTTPRDFTIALRSLLMRVSLAAEWTQAMFHIV